MNRVLKILLLTAVVAGIVMVVASRRGHATSPEVAPSMNSMIW